MSLLRIRGSLADASLHCDWALIDVGREPLTGSGPLADLVRQAREAERVQLLLPAAEVLLARAALPPGAALRSGALLAYAVEELTVGDPESQRVLHLGSSGRDEALAVLAVMDKRGCEAWLAGMDAIQVQHFELHCEGLLLPWHEGEWSLAWDGREGYLRSGQREAGAIDSGDASSPPLALRLLLAEAAAAGAPPPTLVIYPLAEAVAAAPDVAAWSVALGVNIKLAPPWDWRKAPAEAGMPLETHSRRWRLPTLPLRRLKPALWIIGAALIIHALALVFDWSMLANERKQLRRQMEARFRAVFPAAVAVVDPPLQMRRKLSEARHAAGIADDGDFLPMVERVSAAMREAAPASLRSISYENGRMTLELAGADGPSLGRLGSRLVQAGLRVEPDPVRGGARSPGGNSQLTVRAQ